jgi:hypothetical protein
MEVKNMTERLQRQPFFCPPFFAILSESKDLRGAQIFKSRFDPCRLVRQVKEIIWLEALHAFRQDPCRFIRQVNQILQLLQ